MAVMVREPVVDGGPDLQSVLNALDDTACRTIIERLDEPMTASEVSERCDIPMSTTYRKLDLLSEATLLAEGTEIRTDGHHTTRYELDFEAVVVELDDERCLDVELARPARAPEERLASIWEEVRRET